MKTLLPAALTTSLLLSSAFAQTTTEPRPEPVPVERARSAPTFTLYFENDYFGGEDRHYTNGAKLSWVSGDLSEWGQEGWRRGFLENLPFVNSPDRQKNFGFAIGQNIYTPKDTELAVPDPDDRPYAGWSYAELSFISKNDRVMDTISLQLGIVGPSSLAENTQKAIHKLINDDSPRGWDYQLRDEPGINLVYERKWRMAARAFSDTLGIDLIPHIGASVGNVQTYGNAGARVRAGFNLPSDFGVDLIRGGGAVGTPTNDNDPRVSTRKNWSFFVFGGADGRAVARDIFLDGNTWKDSRSVDKKPFVADLYYGLGVIFGTWQLTYTEALRTIEFEGQDGKSYFGSVAISKTF